MAKICEYRDGKCHCDQWKTSESMNDTLESNYQILAKLDAQTPNFARGESKMQFILLDVSNTISCHLKSLFCLFSNFIFLHILWVNARLSPFWINEIGYNLFDVQSWIVDRFVGDSDTKLSRQSVGYIRIAHIYILRDESIDVGVSCKSSVAASGHTQRARSNTTKVNSDFYELSMFFFYFDKIIAFQ